MAESKNLQAIRADVDTLSATVKGIEERICPAVAATPLQQCPARFSVAPMPDITTPILVPGGGEQDPSVLAALGPLAALIGTWASSKTTGFCVMPLPEATAPNQFILKNFYYFEEITFSALPGKVANRGGTYECDSYALLYEQRVYFSYQPQENLLVHAENGSWAHMFTVPQLQGPVGGAPIPSPPAPDPIPPLDPPLNIVKQVSVPHGDSILAPGSFTCSPGAPEIPVVSTLPIGAPPGYDAPYGSNTPSNPNVNPNIVLVQALSNSPPVVRTWTFFVDSGNYGGVANIPFITRNANVERFTNTLWLEQLATGELQMQYSQNISLSFPSTQGGQNIIFPHIVANTLRRVA